MKCCKKILTGATNLHMNLRSARVAVHMRRASTALVILCALALPLSCLAASGPVLLELFTSEGCSSCPPADLLLSHWDHEGSITGVPVICLGYHVHYWNGLGWKDAWSSATFTNRQTDYNTALHNQSNYTPQLVINGREHTVGSKAAEVERLVKAMARSSVATISLTHASSAVNGLSEIRIEADAAAGPLPQECELYAATVLDATQSQVARGENSGRKLNHAAVVRELVRLADDIVISNAGMTRNFSLPSPGSTSRLVLFLQDPVTRHILGATQIRYPR